MPLSRFVFNTFRRLSRRDTSYEPVLPYATYAPWLSDDSFIETYKIVKPYTIVDRYRCYELWQLVEQTAKLSGALIEVGVYRGGRGALIGEKNKIVGKKDKGDLF